MGFDWVGIPIAVAAAVLPFVGVSWLSRGGVASAGFLLPLLAGLLALVVLLVAQYGKKRPLMPLTLISNTLPVVGISCAMVAGAAFTTLLELAVLHLEEIAGWGPVLVGVLLVPQAAGVGMAAALFKRALTTRWLPVLALSGLVAIAGAAVLLLVAVNSGEPLVVAGAGLLMGFGAGAGVTPGLFMGGLSVPTAKLGPTFALVELLRSEAAFILAPVLVHLAVLPTVLATGLRTALWITLVIVVASLPVLVGVLLLSGARPHTPDLHRWLSGETTAYHSPRVAALLRAR